MTYTYLILLFSRKLWSDCLRANGNSENKTFQCNDTIRNTIPTPTHGHNNNFKKMNKFKEFTSIRVGFRHLYRHAFFPDRCYIVLDSSRNEEVITLHPANGTLVSSRKTDWWRRRHIVRSSLWRRRCGKTGQQWSEWNSIFHFRRLGSGSSHHQYFFNLISKE